MAESTQRELTLGKELHNMAEQVRSKWTYEEVCKYLTDICKKAASEGRMGVEISFKDMEERGIDKEYLWIFQKENGIRSGGEFSTKSYHFTWE